VILGTVVIARISSIDPAMVFGSVIAIELGTAIAEHTKGKVKLYTLLYTFILGIAAWFGYSYLANLHLADIPAIANLQNGNFLTWLQMCQVSLGEFLSMVAVSSFSTIPITLLPFAGLGGKPLLDWRRWVWVLMYFVGILGYTVVVLPMPSSWAKPSEPFSVWMGILAIYTVVALVLFTVITARNRKLERLAKLSPGR
jgi:polyferredoxin